MKHLALVGAAALLTLTACSSGSDATVASASPSPSPTPTPAPIVWADGVCAARDNLGATVGALGRNLNYDVASDRSAIEQIDRQLRIQLLAVGQASSELGAALQAVPVDFQQANDFVVTATKAKDDTTGALDQLRTHLDAMVNADSIVSGVAEAGQALVAAKAAFEAGTALVGVVGDGVSNASGELGAAFDAAPACQE